MQSISLLLSALLLLTSSMYTRGGVLDCVSGEMQAKEQTKGHLSVSQLTVGDVIQGVKGAERAPAWCKVKAVYPLPHNETRTTYDGFTDTHMVVDETVHQYGVRQNGTVRIGPVYTLATDCDASVNSAGQVFTPINNGLCPFELSWDEYLTLITAIRRVANRTGYFWFDLSAYHDNDSAMVPYWGMQLSAICRSFMQCAREDHCQEFEIIMERFVHEYLNKEYVEIVERVFPNIGGEVSKEQRRTFTEVARPEKKKNYLLLFTAVGSALFALVIIVAVILLYRGQKKMTTVTRPGPEITSTITV
ncbi:uncharacterized protein LOC111337528 [Stylophora pistillata]|uniref:Uncharacterized protein n=1 Tax=Stylophora pistillata TaxID=50429 RepID=A0A2B4RUE9_STYPI|nr:uncharacterized protein LOC111337528 [Stylophora pistillata]PFX19938.1 hypothetical protein AWC38_SpisGene15620 [Stylophora pistillata]